MKIAILTFPRAINYGTALQAAALFRALKERGHEVSMLEHHCSAVDSGSAVFDVKQIFDVKYDIAHLINFPTAVRRKRNFEKFHSAFMGFSVGGPGEYDMIVAGSDQIWNYNITGDDFFYFLDFPKDGTKKVAYAASFGLSEIDRGYYPRLRSLLCDFDRISVREQTAARIVKDIAGLDVPVVLDPTFLLDRDQWQTIAAPAEDGGKYIFVYTVFNSDALWDFAYRLSAGTGLPIRTISYSRLHRHKAENSFIAGPDQWLRTLMDAEYVVTNSFHGMALSVNFEKQLFFQLPPGKSGVASRLADMAERYALKDRELSVADMTAPLDYSDVRRKLEEDRAFSQEFINDFLN